MLYRELQKCFQGRKSRGAVQKVAHANYFNSKSDLHIEPRPTWLFEFIRDDTSDKMRISTSQVGHQFV